jgi:predicted enzyme related to lactoylglutathione lyase
MSIKSRSRIAAGTAVVALAVFLFATARQPFAQAPANKGVAVGPQYDTTHVYVSAADLDAFVSSFTATFGGQDSKKVVANILPVPSSTKFEYVWTPSGTLSVFAFSTPVPYPFGQERTGYLVTDMNQAMREARDSGAEVLVAPFKDPVGIDAIVQWDGGFRTQLYWHTATPNYGPLETVPENRVYLSPDRAGTFTQQFLRFSRGRIVSDDAKADAGEIGRPGETFRRIRLESQFGKMQINVTDGHLPYPFGRELTGYQVADLDETLAKARAAGATILFGPYGSADRANSIVQFPGGYIAEIHARRRP